MEEDNIIKGELVGVSDIDNIQVNLIEVLFEALNKKDRKTIDSLFERFWNYATKRQKQFLNDLINAVMERDTSKFRSIMRYNGGALGEENLPLIEYLMTLLQGIVKEEVSKLTERERIIYNLTDCYLEDLSTMESQVAGLFGIEYPRRETVDRISNLSRSDVKKNSKVKGLTVYEDRSFKSQYLDLLLLTFPQEVTGLTSMFPSYSARIYDRTLYFYDQIKDDGETLYSLSYKYYRSLDDIPEGTAKTFYEGKLIEEASSLAVIEMMEDPEVLKGFDWDKAIEEYKRLQLLFNKMADDLIKTFSRLDAVKKIIEEERSKQEEIGYTPYGSDVKSRTLISLLSSSPKHRSDMVTLMDKGYLSLNKGRTRGSDGNEIPTTEIRFTNPNKQASYNLTILKKKEQAEEETELKYMINAVSKMVSGGMGLKVLLASWVVFNKFKSRYVKDISSYYMLTEIMGYKSVTPKLTEDFEKALLLLDRGEFNLNNLNGDGKTVQSIRPLTVWSSRWEIKEDNKSRKPMEVKEFKETRLKSFDMEANPEFYKLTESNQYILFDERVCRIDGNKYPIAIQLYFYAMLRFRSPDQLEHEHIKAKTESLFRWLDLPVSPSDPHISRNYINVKKNINHLIEFNLLGGKTEVIENDGGTFKELLNRVWKLYPSDKSMKDFDRIKQLREHHRGIMPEEETFSPEDVRKIWNESGLSLREFSEKIGTNHSILSKFFNGKTGKLSDKIIMKLKEYISQK